VTPFAEWFAELDAVASAKIVRTLARMEQGNVSNVKGVGEGVMEYRIDFGPGYRIYFGRDGDTIHHPAHRRNQEAPTGTTSMRRMPTGVNTS
jgi:putative addiction module killer protein